MGLSDIVSRASRWAGFAAKAKTYTGVKRPDPHTWITVLAGATPIAEGTVRQVWDRPGYPDQLLKTIQPGKVQKFANRSPVHRFIDDLRYGPYRTFRVEYRYYAKAAYKSLKTNRPNPIAEMGGLIVTDHGLAQVVEKITDKSGGLAKTLNDLIKDRALDENKVQWLNEFTRSLFILQVTVPDLSSANIVFDEVRSRFLLIDGYGDKAKIPIRSLFKCLNSAKLDYRIENRVTEAGYLDWDPTFRKFVLA